MKWESFENLNFSEITERWTPVDLHKLWSAGCCQTGWHSTWLTAGGTFAYLRRSCSFLVEKLLTPIARAWPDAYNPSIAVHVSGRHRGTMSSGAKPRVPDIVRTGQWIYYTAKKTRKWVSVKIIIIMIGNICTMSVSLLAFGPNLSISLY